MSYVHGGRRHRPKPLWPIWAPPAQRLDRIDRAACSALAKDIPTNPGAAVAHKNTSSPLSDLAEEGEIYKTKRLQFSTTTQHVRLGELLPAGQPPSLSQKQKERQQLAQSAVTEPGTCLC